MTEFNAFDVTQVTSGTQPRNRSRACLHCRRRKMRCDGVKPACFQCVRADRGSECEYDNGTTKTATQLLYEKLHHLEKRYRELQAQNPSLARTGPHSKSSKRGTSVVSGSSRGGRITSQSSNYTQQSNIAYGAATSVSSGSSVASTPTPPLPPQLHLEPHHTPFDPPLSFYEKSLPFGAPNLVNTPNAHSPGNHAAFLGPNHFSYSHQNEFSALTTAPSFSPFGISDFHPDDATSELSPSMAQYLFESFLPHAQQCGLSIRSEFLLQGSRTPSPTNQQYGTWSGPSTPPSPSLDDVTQLHTALVNAVYMWGAHFATEKSITPLASMFAKRTSEALPELVQLASGAPRTPSNSTSSVVPHVLIQAIQAATLLATYYFAHDRTIEGSYQANTASALAISAGLHRMAAPRYTSGNAYTDRADCSNGTAAQIPPARDDLEWAERLLTFWNVYVLEGTWCVIDGFPSGRWNGRELRTRITAPWPKDLEVYGAYSPVLGHPTQPDQYHSSAPGCTVTDFLVGRNINTSPSRLELRAKSAALYEQAVRLEKTRDPASQDYRTKFAAAQGAAQRFLHAIPTPRAQEYHTSSYSECSLITSRTLVLATDIKLHYELASESTSALERCLGAAREIVRVVSILAHEDYLFLEPIVASCWSLAATVFVRVLSRIPPNNAGMNERVQLHKDVERLINGLSILGSIFPTAATQAQKIEAMLRNKRPCD